MPPALGACSLNHWSAMEVPEILSVFKYGYAAWRGNGKLRHNEQGKSVILYTE